ncbi:hypothetical protein KA531_01380 [Candidatus Saccharibacteria bacterium]|nr:hypothetical protein [Candidatus Saccharibacteria bacterium]
MLKTFDKDHIDLSLLLSRPIRRQDRQSLALVASDLLSIHQVEPLYRTIADNYQFFLENKPDLNLPISDINYLTNQPRNFNQIVYGTGSSFNEKLRSSVARSLAINPMASLSFIGQSSKWLLNTDKVNISNLDLRLIIDIHQFRKLTNDLDITLPQDTDNLILLEDSINKLMTKLSLSSIGLILRDKLWLYFSPINNLIINFTIPSSLMLDLIQVIIISFQEPNNSASLNLVGSILTKIQSSQLELSLDQLKSLLV